MTSLNTTTRPPSSVARSRIRYAAPDVDLYRHRAGRHAVDFEAALDPGVRAVGGGDQTALRLSVHQLAEAFVRSGLPARVRRAARHIRRCTATSLSLLSKKAKASADSAMAFCQPPQSWRAAVTSVHSAIQPPLARAARLDLDDASVGERDVARMIFAVQQLRPAFGDEPVGIAQQEPVVDLAAGDFQPDHLFVGQAEQFGQGRHGAEQIMEMPLT